MRDLAGGHGAAAPGAPMRLLMLANVVPYPARGGLHLRLFNLLTRLARRHEVSLGCHSWGDDLDGADWLNRHGIRTVAAPLVGANRSHAGPALRAMLGGRPPELAQFQSPVLHALVAAGGYDVLQIEETLLTPYLASLPRGTGARTVLTLHNLHFVQERRIARLEPERSGRLWRDLNGAMMRRYEPAAAARFDRVVTVSDADRDALRARAPALAVDVDVVPNGVDTETLRPLPPPPAAPAIVFVGTLSYRPCSDAAIWLVEAVLPILRRRFPTLAVWIVGKQPPPAVQALADERVVVTGEVDDVVPWYAQSSVAVVPIRGGGGSRLKILEAMALGRPVVSTTLGAEGLAVRDGETIRIADDAAAFAAAVAALLTDAGEARRLATNARRFVEAHHDWDDIAARQLAIYDELAVPA